MAYKHLFKYNERIGGLNMFAAGYDEHVWFGCLALTLTIMLNSILVPLLKDRTTH